MMQTRSLKRRPRQTKYLFRRNFSCSFADCSVTDLSGPQLIHHLVHFHNVPYIKASHFGAEFSLSDIPLNSTCWTWTLGIVYSHKIHFLLNMAIRDKKIYLWCSTLEPTLPANKVDKFHIKLTPKDKENMITVGSWSIESRPFNFSRIHIFYKDWVARVEEDFAKFVEYYVWKTEVPYSVCGFDDGSSEFCTSLKMDVQIQTGDEMRQAFVSSYKGFVHVHGNGHGYNSNKRY